MIFYLLNMSHILNKLIKYPFAYKLSTRNYKILLFILFTSMFYYTGLNDYLINHYNIVLLIRMKPIFIFISIIHFIYLLSQVFIKIYNLVRCIKLFKINNESKLIIISYYLTSLLSIFISLIIIYRIEDKIITINNEIILLLLIFSVLCSTLFTLQYISLNNNVIVNKSTKYNINKTIFTLLYFITLLLFYFYAIIPAIQMLVDFIVFKDNNLKLLIKYSYNHLYDESNNSDDTITNSDSINENNQCNVQVNTNNNNNNLINTNNQTNSQLNESNKNINNQSNIQKVNKTPTL